MNLINPNDDNAIDELGEAIERGSAVFTPVSEEEAARIDLAAGIETIQIRLHKNTVSGLQFLANAQGTSLQVFLNRVLTGIAGANGCQDVRENTKNRSN